MALDGGGENGSGRKERKRKRRWGEAPPPPAAAAAAAAAAEPTTTAAATSEDPKAKILAMQESIKARLAAAKAKQQTTTTTRAASLKRPAPSEVPSNKAKKAKHFDLDMSVTGPTYKQQQQQKVHKPAKKVNPYLAHTEEEAETDVVDDRLARAAKPRPRRDMKFVEPGAWQEIAQRKREKAQKAAESGYVSGRKTGHTIQAASMANVYGPDDDEYDDTDKLAPRWDAHPDTKMPLTMEWWDVELLPTKLKKQVASVESKELSKQSQAALQSLDAQSKDKSEHDNDDAMIKELRQQCFQEAALSYCKTAALVQHIVPVKPPHADTGPPKQPTLHLTKKELKRQRKLRRQEKQRELQDMQAAGLVPAPEPRLTLSNFIRVLGDQAYLDPSQMEQKVLEQMQARQRAHLERNEANKLTSEQRREKRAKKLTEDTSHGVTVAIFWVKDMSHPYHRAKVDLNAQQNNLTGGVLECPQLACVIVEGGPKAIKRYKRLMLVRMKWTGPDDDQDHDDVNDDLEEGDGPTHKFNPDNKCELVWEGMAVKPLFKGFIFQACETSDQARKILKQKGVAHYWDQVLQHASGRGANLTLRLAADSDDEEDNPYEQKDEDVVMKDNA